MKKTILKSALLVIASIGLMAGSALATPLVLDVGTKIVAVDGDRDDNLTVGIASRDIWDGYKLQFSVNNADWIDVSDGWGYDTFTGGDIIDFALVGTDSSLYGTNANEFYILSNDADDDLFSATMTFVGELAASDAQQPLRTEPYYRDLFITWDIEGFKYDNTYSNSFTISFGSDGVLNDGVAPIPEPATMLLFGTGLAGLAGLRRKKGEKA